MLLSSEQCPQAHYQVVVIGGGLGGMTVANILASRGQQVLLLEAHDKLGGLATWFHRRSHIFDVALHGFPYGMLKSLRRYWGKSIADLIVPLKNVRFINPQFDLTTSYTREDFGKLLLEHFKIPPQTTHSFFERVMGITADGGPNTNEVPFSAGQLFDEYFPGRPDVVRFLMEPITYANGHTLEDPALTYAIVFANFMRHGIYTIEGGTDLLVSMMQDELIKNKVDIKLNTAVNTIRITPGSNKVCGVEIDGRLINAPIVISNANLLATIHSMVGDTFFRKEFLQKVSAVELNTSSCQVYLGIKDGETIPEVGDLIFYSDAHHFDTELLLNKKISSRTFSLYYPRQRPHSNRSNRYTIVASSNSRYSDWQQLSPAEYRAAKQAMIEDTLQCLERLLPEFVNIRDKIDCCTAATPLTFERYTRHWQGASFGTKYPGLAISQQLSTEIAGLYHCGSVGIIMSGWLGAINYAAITANAVEGRLLLL
ncbi:MAG: NAD(P)/FAD-dependent oxidoreductase [Oligoflexia bacterium]|nr:NAD(P)/FAD-dependent oxidoreductase [Oligoflexia bacterium]